MDSYRFRNKTSTRVRANSLQAYRLRLESLKSTVFSKDRAKERLNAGLSKQRALESFVFGFMTRA